MKPPQAYRQALADAVEQFWATKDRQQQHQGTATGRKDYGSRGSVTGGQHLNGLSGLFSRIITDCGIPETNIHIKRTTVPGYFRPSKEWDLLVVVDDRLVAAIEFKSHVGSFGNNFNNRVEEALGNATDLWTAYREKVFKFDVRPWLGYSMLLEKAPGSCSDTRTRAPHFPIAPEFESASYVKRYRLFCERLMLERLYDASCLVTSPRNERTELGQYEEPSEEIGFVSFVSSLQGRITAEAARLRGQQGTIQFDD